MNKKLSSVLVRFLKGMIAGAVGSMAVVTINMPTAWSGFVQIFNSLGIAALFGAITGLLLALEKWATWTE